MDAIEPTGRRSKLKLDKPPAKLIKSNVPWFDELVADENTGTRETGIPTEDCWIILAGAPGHGKTTLGIALLDGFGKNPHVETEFIDFESGEHRTKKTFERVGQRFIETYSDNPKWNVIEHIDNEAERLHKLGRTYVVLIDSYDYLTDEDSLAKLKKVAEDLQACKKRHTNLVLITINHETKQRKVAGPMQLQRKCDVVVHVSKETEEFRVLTFPKNRLTTDETPERVKIYMEKGKGLFRSVEPDFITDNPLIQGFRKLGGFLNNAFAKKPTE